MIEIKELIQKIEEEIEYHNNNLFGETDKGYHYGAIVALKSILRMINQKEDAA